VRPRRCTISARTLHVRADARVCPHGRECFTLGNFKKDAIVRPSHGRPRGHRPSVRLSEIVCVTTLAHTSASLMELIKEPKTEQMRFFRILQNSQKIQKPNAPHLVKSHRQTLEKKCSKTSSGQGTR
jgi:hypothetical protein